MKAYLYIAIILLAIACKPNNDPTPSNKLQIDSIYTQADFRKYGDFYDSNHQVYAIDMLSNGLTYDSLFYISGSGCNLYLSDVFTAKDSVKRIPAGEYQMDSIAKENTFLRGMDFDGNITGTYMLVIKEDKIQAIKLFTAGKMKVDYLEEDIILDLHLYTADSTLYHATYQGAAMYR